MWGRPRSPYLTPPSPPARKERPPEQPASNMERYLSIYLVGMFANGVTFFSVSVTGRAESAIKIPDWRGASRGRQGIRYAEADPAQHSAITPQAGQAKYGYFPAFLAGFTPMGRRERCCSLSSPRRTDPRGHRCKASERASCHHDGDDRHWNLILAGHQNFPEQLGASGEIMRSPLPPTEPGHFA